MRLRTISGSFVASALAAAALGLAALLPSCEPASGPQVGSQTNWLHVCDKSSECGDLECVCGTCTASCESDQDCASVDGDASCVPAEDPGAIALCGGYVPPSSVCLARCTDDECPEDASCVAGVCVPDGNPTVEVSLDPGVRFQTLEGFGAGIAWAETLIATHPAAEALYDSLFVDAGLDAVRLRNQFTGDNEPNFEPTTTIITEISERLGHDPLVILTSSAPPAALKENGDVICAGNPDTCTLAHTNGVFDYTGFAGYLRETVELHQAAGIQLDYLGLQNHPNLVPSTEGPGFACRFLPEEGIEAVTVEGVSVEAPMAGYREALAATRAAFVGLVNAPRLTAAESTGLRSVSDYVPVLAPNEFDAIAFHLYGVDPAAIDPSLFASVRTLSEASGHPAIQTEVQENARNTAVLIHHTLVDAGASAYLQFGLVTDSPDATNSLVHLTDDSFEQDLLYDVFAHYARSTDPGWVRVDASSSASDVLVSAWLSPDESSLTLVLVNSAASDRSTRITVPEAFALAASEVTRTVFDGVERSVLLGQLPDGGEVRLPAGSVVTVALTLD